MKKMSLILGLALFCTFIAFGQEKEEKKTVVVESVYILPKRGMSDKFEQAIKAHNDKFHPEGDYVAGLRKVDYGEKAGWYVWIMGPTTYAALDTRPQKENGHHEDWEKNIDPLVEKYGAVNLWNFNEKLSFGMDLVKKSKHYEAWAVDIKRGQYYRFKAIAEKLMKTSESLGVAFLVFNNPLHTPGGADVGLVWNFDSYDAWSQDIGFMKAYEKLYGKGTWQNMIDEWFDIMLDYNAELRSIVH
ncbi:MULTISPECIES: hypothetical protein [Marinifilum]|uniref:hypothetical protein n=1 Tax=Marinifilum TaxID=866673 RepID=UPI0022732BC1|nr:MULTISPECIES: hypothetical protein [Marinifilum]MCY1636607.1 hypothetical protein [Marinifilum sp. D737]